MSKILTAICASALLLGLSSAPAQAADYTVEIARTQYGIPHISGADFGSVGYGQAYAYLEDNLCLIADKVVTVSGERSKYFGAEAKTTVAFSEVANLDSDVFFKSYLDLPTLRKSFAKASPDYQNLVRGYVAGYNRFLRDHVVSQRPVGCQGDWVRAVSLDDMLALNEERMVQASGGAWLRQVTAAAPPAAPASVGLASLGFPVEPATFGLGSNGWAFGSEVTANKSGILLGNPHFPWATTNRFYELHLTVPGKLDTMGVSIAGAPGISIGFNHDVAWTHTVSTDRHFTVFELTLDPKDPTAYLVDGTSVPMSRKTVSVEVKGEATPRTRTIFSSNYGAMVVMPQVGVKWTDKVAYALKDANKNNTRSGDTWLNIARAKSASEIKTTIEQTLGIPWVNTIVADRHGEVLYADVTATPNVSAEKAKTCAPVSGLGPLAASARIYMLDGSRSACDWDVVAGTPAPGLLPGASMPSTLRRDYVANSNDSYWLANPRAPITGQPPIVGPGVTTQNLRTRSGLMEIEARLDGSDGLPGKTFDAATVEAMLYRNKNLAADLVLGDLATLCVNPAPVILSAEKTIDLVQACSVLAKWDRRMNLDSVGAHLFIEFWKIAEDIPKVWAVGFDPADPVHTPRGLKMDPETGAKILRALARAVDVLDTNKIALDAPWGQVQFALHDDQRIPVHGGEGSDGVLNAQQSQLIAGVGYVPFHGSSYIQVVTFDAAGPVADAIMTYSQSTDPASAHAADQTALHAQKGWVRLPFGASAIAADQAVTRKVLEE